MSKPKKIGQCAYCSEIHPITDDHIPPKNLFPKPRASNLITVPCCEACRAGWSKDDEYFRVAILSSARVAEEELSQGAIDSLCRSLGRIEQRGFAKNIMSSIEEINIFAKSGIYLGKETAFNFDANRIDRVTQRILRGLFFHEKGYPLPSEYEVFAIIQQFGLEKFLEKLPPRIQFPEVRIIQDGIFCYTLKETQEDPNSCIWILWFFKKLPLVGCTRLPISHRSSL